MCGLTKLGTNAVTISSKATVKERNNVYMTYPFLLSLSRSHIVTSKISFGALWLYV